MREAWQGNCCVLLSAGAAAVAPEAALLLQGDLFGCELPQSCSALNKCLPLEPTD